MSTRQPEFSDDDGIYELILLWVSTGLGVSGADLARLSSQRSPATSKVWLEIEAVTTHLFQEYFPTPTPAFAPPKSLSSYPAQAQAEHVALDRVLEARERLVRAFSSLPRSDEAYAILPGAAHSLLDHLRQLLQRLHEQP